MDPLNPAIRQATDLLTGQGQSGETMPSLHWRTGPVVSVNAVAGTAVVTIGGVDVTCRWVRGHQPAVAEVVTVLVAPPTYLILGISSTGPDVGVSSYEAKAYRTTTWSSGFTAATEVTVPFEAESFDVGGLWSAGAPSRLTFPVAGSWTIGGQIHWSGNVSGSTDYRQATSLRVTFNAGGTLHISRYQEFYPRADRERYSPAPVVVQRLSAGDYVELMGFQSTGAAMSALASLTEASTYLWARYNGA